MDSREVKKKYTTTTVSDDQVPRQEEQHLINLSIDQVH